MESVLKLKRVAVTVAAVAAAVGVLACSEHLRDGVRNGISLCLTSVIPSLFLFTAAALFISYSGTAETLGRLISPITKRLFGLEASAATAWLLSAVSGYPVGARLVSTLYESGTVTRARALKMLTCSINAGPAFIITAVGSSVLGSAADGRRLLTAHLLSTVLLAFAVRFLPDKLFSKASFATLKTVPQKSQMSLSDAFVSAVSDAGQTMLTVCTFVVFFSGVGSMLSAVPSAAADALRPFLEVTVGVQECTRKELPKAAFLLGFGGVSVIFQVMSAARAVRPPLALVTVSRVLHGAFSAGIVCIAELLFPRSISTGSFGAAADTAAVHTSPLAAAALMVMCVVLLAFTQNTVKRLKNNG